MIKWEAPLRPVTGSGVIEEGRYRSAREILRWWEGTTQGCIGRGAMCNGY